MERSTNIIKAKEIMGQNFIGPSELKAINEKFLLLNSELLENDSINKIPFSENELALYNKTHLLILIIPEHFTKEKLQFKHFREHFGINPDEYEPCFYNQDWYLNEAFYNNSTLEFKWQMVQKEIVNESRGKNPVELNITNLNKSLIYTYTFFIYYLVKNEILWENDYIWCIDLDSNEDQIYVGRYKDSNKINKNGFSIHRHLKIKYNYGILNVK
jgi:hypothetical protein